VEGYNKSMPKFDDVPADIAQIVANHVKLYLTHPEEAHMWDSTPVGVPGPVPTLLLTTKGRKTGKERHVPLLYVDNEGSYLVVGSKGGHSQDPVWYLNLQENSECEIRVAKFRTKSRARTLEGEERERAWNKVVAQHPVYIKYQQRTERQIPLILLEPIDGRP
jgi:deazaflavin-dependent oxidoreductase (nitroreductase family)